MDEVQRLFGGEIYCDNFVELARTLTVGNLIDSAMYGCLMFRFLINWTPNWFRSCIVNPIMSLFTKTKFYRKYKFCICSIVSLSIKLQEKALYDRHVRNSQLMGVFV